MGSNFVIRNEKTCEYFQNSHYGFKWTKELKKAKKYTSLGVAKNIAVRFVDPNTKITVLELAMEIKSTTPVTMNDRNASLTRRQDRQRKIVTKRAERIAKHALAELERVKKL